MTVLLACDPSEPHDLLIRQVLERRWTPGTEFFVLAVVEPIPPDIIPETVPELIAAATRTAESKVEAIAGNLKASGLRTSPIVLEGDPRHVITDEALVLDAGLILLGPPHRHTALPFLGGRVAKAVLRHSERSVQIVRTGSVKRVLVPSDGSDYSLKAAHAIAARPWPEATEFEVISVIEPLPASVKFLYPPHVYSAEAEGMREQSVRRAQNAIQSTEQILLAAGLRISDNVLAPVEPAAKLILEEAARWNADLICVGSHGQRGLGRLLIGSVSESAALHAHCSVEVVR